MIRTGLYAGTFDPITNGHIDIVQRAVKLVDRLVIGVAVNRDKGPLFSLEERVEMVRQETAKSFNGAEVLVQPFENLLMHFARDIGASVIIFRTGEGEHVVSVERLEGVGGDDGEGETEGDEAEPEA